MPKPTDFGCVLRELREARHVSQVRVAEALRINATLISNIERGHADLLAPSHFKALRKVLRLGPRDFVRLRRARLMTILERALEHELRPQAIQRMKAVIAVSRPGKQVRL